MNSLFGVVLPVCNAELRLREQVQQVLDVVSELTSHFEVLIVDDASSDQTEEVARELATQFPQIRCVRHAERRGFAAACRTGLLNARGEMIFVQEPDLPVSANELRQFWRQRNASGPMPSPKPLDSSLIQRLLSWAAALREELAPAAPKAIDAPAATATNASAAHAIPGPIAVRRASSRPIS